MKKTCRYVRQSRLATKALRETIDELFRHLIDTVPWEEREIALAGLLLCPFEVTTRIEEVWRFWTENDVAERAQRRNFLAPLPEGTLGFANLFHEALAAITGERTRLPGFALPDGREATGPTLSPPKKSAQARSLTWRASLQFVA